MRNVRWGWLLLAALLWTGCPAGDDDDGGDDDDAGDDDGGDDDAGDDDGGDDDDDGDDDGGDDDAGDDDSGDDDTAPPGPLAQLWTGTAHFVVDQDPVPVTDPTSGHREAYAVNRPDLSPTTVYLYHRCFGQGAYDASICLSISDDGADSFHTFHGEMVAPQPGHTFAVAPAVFEKGGSWYMVYEESHVAALYWASSADGLSWTVQGQLLDHGGSGAWDQGAMATPGVLVNQWGTIYVFYAGFPLGGNTMSVGYASGGDLGSLIKYSGNPVFTPAGSGWDGAHVSMPRLLAEDGTTYLVYEGADTDFTCEASNRYGWGMARTTDPQLAAWDRHPDNPFGLSAQSPYGCGNDMPSGFQRGDGAVFVYHTSADTSRIVREHLAVDPPKER